MNFRIRNFCLLLVRILSPKKLRGIVCLEILSILQTALYVEPGHFNVKVLTQRGVNSLHEATNKLFYIYIFFFQKRATCEKREIRSVL